MTRQNYRITMEFTKKPTDIPEILKVIDSEVCTQFFVQQGVTQQEYDAEIQKEYNNIANLCNGNVEKGMEWAKHTVDLNYYVDPSAY